MSPLCASLPEGSQGVVITNGVIHRRTDRGAGAVEGDFGRNG